MDNICHLSSNFFFVFRNFKFDKKNLMFHMCHLAFEMHPNNKKPCSLQDSFKARPSPIAPLQNICTNPHTKAIFAP